MRCVMLMFDSLNRHFLPPYGCDWTRARNFARLAERCATFDRSYVGSMPCMPARRELHSGRHNFLHNGWCPLEPYDDSLPELLRERGISSHLITDHYHYWEDGGAGYMQRYDTWQTIRGQEGDPWIGQIADPAIPEHINGKSQRQDWINRPFTARDENHYQTATIARGLDFLERNADEQDWLLQIECFDPHEPFCSDPHWHELYRDDYDGPLFDWPGYRKVRETPEQIAHIRNNYAALLSKCDDSLGKVLDAFDRHGLWRDTMLVVWTDHGFLLGEHDWWAKNAPPPFEEVSHTPFFVHDPRHPDAAGQRRGALVQPAVDLAPTLLRFFGGEATEHMVAGHDLEGAIASDRPVREAAIFGYFGKGINVTDGRHVCYREVQDPDAPLYRYTLGQAGQRRSVSAELLHDAELHPGFGFSKGRRLWRIPAENTDYALGAAGETWLFDCERDPQQQSPVNDPGTVDALLAQAAELIRAHDAPPELYQRLGLRQTPVTR